MCGWTWRARWSRGPTRSGAVAALGAFAVAAAAGFGGCTAGPGPVPGDPIAPPPEGAWRPGEALAYVLKPPRQGVRPISDDYLENTQHYRVRIAEAEALAVELRRIEKLDRGGRRTWFFDGPEAVFLRIDVDDDGTVDQAQYFGPEGLFAVVHRFSSGRRVQKIFWPPGEPRIVEIRNSLPPYPGVWWRSEENPFRTPPGGDPSPDLD